MGKTLNSSIVWMQEKASAITFISFFFTMPSNAWKVDLYQVH